jgi:hypothetical protein
VELSLRAEVRMDYSRVKEAARKRAGADVVRDRLAVQPASHLTRAARGEPQHPDRRPADEHSAPGRSRAAVQEPRPAISTQPEPHWHQVVHVSAHLRDFREAVRPPATA